MKLTASFKLKPGYEYIKCDVVREGDFVVCPTASLEGCKWYPADGLIHTKVEDGIILNTIEPNTWLACRKIPALVAKEGCEFVKKGEYVKLGDFVTDDKFWRPAAGLVTHEVGANGRVKSNVGNKLTSKWFACRPIPSTPKTIKITVEIDGQSKSFTVVI